MLDYDQDQLQEMHTAVKKQGELYWKQWIEFVEQRSVIATRRIDDKSQLVERVNYLLEPTRLDHAAAIVTLQEQVITEENTGGLIPV